LPLGPFKAGSLPIHEGDGEALVKLQHFDDTICESVNSLRLLRPLAGAPDAELASRTLFGEALLVVVVW
jgi:hypothetical protein